MSGSTLLDGITLYIQLISSSCLFQNFGWMESPCMFKLSVLHVWFKTFRLNHPVSKFWTRHEKQTSWIYRVIPSKSFEPDMKNWQVEHKGWLHPNVLNQHPVCSSCQYFMSGLKLLDGITLYVQIVCSSCLVQNFWMETPCMFSLSTTWSTDKLNIQGDSIQKLWTRLEVLTSWTYGVIQSKSFEPDKKYLQIEHKGRFHLKVLNQTWIEPPCMFNLSVFHVWFKTWMESPCMFNLSVLHVWFKTFGWNHPVCSTC
jgi:hypothetical protein